MFKPYSSKSSAIKGAKRNGVDPADVKQNEAGEWGFNLGEVDSDADAALVHSEDATAEDRATDPDGVNPDGSFSPAKEVTATATGRKIEKDREERNGVKRPSAGGMCRAVWDWCDAHVSDNTIPTAKQVKEAATENGWNANNASIEYYNWRKFMGVRARSTTLPE